MPDDKGVPLKQPDLLPEVLEEPLQIHLHHIDGPDECVLQGVLPTAWPKRRGQR